MSVLAADQAPATGSNNEAATGNGSPTDGGFTPGWDQEAEQRVQARRPRVQAAATENPRPPTQPQSNADEIDEDDEERMLQTFKIIKL